MVTVSVKVSPTLATIATEGPNATNVAGIAAFVSRLGIPTAKLMISNVNANVEIRVIVIFFIFWVRLLPGENSALLSSCAREERGEENPR